MKTTFESIAFGLLLLLPCKVTAQYLDVTPAEIQAQGLVKVVPYASMWGQQLLTNTSAASFMQSYSNVLSAYLAGLASTSPVLSPVTNTPSSASPLTNYFYAVTALVQAGTYWGHVSIPDGDTNWETGFAATNGSQLIYTNRGAATPFVNVIQVTNAAVFGIYIRQLQSSNVVPNLGSNAAVWLQRLK